MALNRSDKSRILRRYFPGMTRNSEMSTEPRQTAAAALHFAGARAITVINPTLAHAAELAGRQLVQAAVFEGLPAAPVNFVITSG